VPGRDSSAARPKAVSRLLLGCPSDSIELREDDPGRDGFRAVCLRDRFVELYELGGGQLPAQRATITQATR
jgi:hypothetical protein